MNPSKQRVYGCGRSWKRARIQCLASELLLQREERQIIKHSVAALVGCQVCAWAPDPASSSVLGLLHMVRPGSSSLHWFCWQDNTQRGQVLPGSRCTSSWLLRCTQQGHQAPQPHPHNCASGWRGEKRASVGEELCRENPRHKRLS